MSAALVGANLQTTQVTVATGTAARLVSAPTVEPMKRSTAAGVIIKAHDANTAKVYLGITGVTVATGYELGASQSIVIPVDDPSKIYAITTGSQIVSIMWLGPA